MTSRSAVRVAEIRVLFQCAITTVASATDVSQRVSATASTGGQSITIRSNSLRTLDNSRRTASGRKVDCISPALELIGSTVADVSGSTTAASFQAARPLITSVSEIAGLSLTLALSDGRR